MPCLTHYVEPALWNTLNDNVTLPVVCLHVYTILSSRRAPHDARYAMVWLAMVPTIYVTGWLPTVSDCRPHWCHLNPHRRDGSVYHSSLQDGKDTNERMQKN